MKAEKLTLMLQDMYGKYRQAVADVLIVRLNPYTEDQIQKIYDAIIDSWPTTKRMPPGWPEVQIIIKEHNTKKENEVMGGKDTIYPRMSKTMSTHELIDGMAGQYRKETFEAGKKFSFQEEFKRIRDERKELKKAGLLFDEYEVKILYIAERKQPFTRERVLKYFANNHIKLIDSEVWLEAMIYRHFFTTQDGTLYEMTKESSEVLVKLYDIEKYRAWMDEMEFIMKSVAIRER
jgi:hypothetical protein